MNGFVHGFAVDLIPLFVAITLFASVGAAVYAFWRTNGVDEFRADVRRLRDELESVVKTMRADFDKLVSEVSHAHDEHRRGYKRLADDVEEMFERATAERRRVDGRRGGRPPSAPEAPPAPTITTRDEYVRHLERGGASLPDVERALGI